jgi:hypothetical protein
MLRHSHKQRRSSSFPVGVREQKMVVTRAARPPGNTESTTFMPPFPSQPLADTRAWRSPRDLLESFALALVLASTVVGAVSVVMA